MTNEEMLRKLEEAEVIAEKMRSLFARWLIRCAREVRQRRAARERDEQARLFSKFEHVGGPLDGKTIHVENPALIKYEGRGYYDLEKDRRFHYHELAASWFED